MVFSSHVFIYYYLPVLLAIYYALARQPQRWRNFVLIITGYFFYGWANPKFIFLMFGTTFVDWLLSLIIAWDDWRFWKAWGKDIVPLTRGQARSSRQFTAITLSVISNLLNLGFFKYFNFGLDSYNAVMHTLGMANWQADTFFRVVLPLGISFYTFQSLSYIIDVYRGDAKAMKSFTDFSCFVSMCPHLVAGPILKFHYLADQLESRTLTAEKFARGAALFSMGMAKKILLANPCGKIADTTFNAGFVHTPDAWFGAVAYAFQIYFDFSGYSDMAIGLGLMLGFVFAKNFDDPYKSQSITEFWRRWHISLSSWLRDYLYIPLGGNRKGKIRTYVNLMLVMLLGGLWHGASWTFVIWGGIHGGMLAFERTQGKESVYRRLPAFFKVAITFFTVLIAWVFFRAADLHAACHYLTAMAGLSHAPPAAGLLAGILYKPYYLLCFLGAALVVWLGHSAWEFTRTLSWPKIALCLFLFWVALIVMATQQYNPFIYFIF